MKRIILLCAGIAITLCTIFYASLPRLPLLEGIKYGRALKDNHGNLLHLGLATDQHYRYYSSLSSVPPILLRTTMLQEEHHFMRDFSVNPWALLRAAIETYILHGHRQGGSTVTMQVARLRFHINSASIIGKLKQIYLAMAIGKYYNKHDILTAYVNLLPYGGNINGMRAASLIYFHIEPKNLSLLQSLTLTVIPQNPNKRMPRGHKIPVALTRARNHLLHEWQQYYPHAEHDNLSLSQLPIALYSRQDIPNPAPHFSNYVLQHYKENNTTLNLTIQNTITLLTQQYIAQHRSLGMSNAAVLVVNTASMKVEAMLGSADFYSQVLHGQVNGTLAERSPGSTLKPFIYALAIDQGLINPLTILYDLPSHFSNYQPTNFDGEYMGPITATTALNNSRNIPAVWLDEKLHKHDLYSLLKQANIKNLHKRQHYGLSLALGGGEISMLELARLYAMLANAGKLYPLHVMLPTNTRPSKTQQLLSPEACYLILSMLSRHAPLQALPVSAWQDPLPAIAWKTGTSSGFRDAWSVGLFGNHLIVVWVGNFNAQRNPNASGITAAAPLMFRIIAALKHQVPSTPLLPNRHTLNLRKVAVCTDSGLMATTYCPHTAKTWIIPGVSATAVDNIYQPIAINPTTHMRACQIGPHTVYKSFAFYPSNILQALTDDGMIIPTPPALPRHCNIATGASHISITSPWDQHHYHITRATSLLPFSVISTSCDGKVFWMVDKQVVAHINNNHIYYWHMSLGKHTIEVIDQQGHSATVIIDVL